MKQSLLVSKNKKIRKEVFRQLKASFFYTKLFLGVSILVIVSSCSLTSSTGKGTGKELYTTFYVGDEGTQYFIKPLSFGNEQKEEFIADFTFRNNPNDNDTGKVVINFSVITNQLIRNVDSVQIFNSNQSSMSILSPSIMFKERLKKGNYLVRASGQQSQKKLIKLFSSEDWKIKVFYGENHVVFNSTKQTNKSISNLQLNLFDLL